MKQTTFLMIKPDGIKNKEAIIEVLNENGITVELSNQLNVNMKIMGTLLTHYEAVIDDMGKDFNFVGKLFNSFYFGNHQIIPMKVSYTGDADIITLTRTLIGATNPAKAEKGTIRNTFSNDNYDLANKAERLVNNVIHASDSKENALRELDLWEAYIQG